MTDAQFEALRALELELRTTILSGDLHVRDSDGVDWLLTPAGELEPFAIDRGRRATPATFE